MTLWILVLVPPLCALLVAVGHVTLRHGPSWVAERKARAARIREDGPTQFPQVHAVAPSRPQQIARYGVTDVLEAALITSGLEDDDDEITEAERTVDRRRAAYEAHGHPLVRTPHFMIGVFIVLAIGIPLAVSHLQLEIGILKDLGVDPAKATVLGSVMTSFLLLTGGFAVELAAPTWAPAEIKALSPIRRHVLLALAAGTFSAVVAVLVYLAPIRADERYGTLLDEAKAGCTAAQEAGEIVAAEAACARASRLAAKYQKVRQVDQTTALVTPIGEAAGAWALLRAAEAGVGLFHARRLHRSELHASRLRQRRAARQRRFIRDFLRDVLTAGRPLEEGVQAISQQLQAPVETVALEAPSNDTNSGAAPRPMTDDGSTTPTQGTDPTGADGAADGLDDEGPSRFNGF